MMLILDFFEKKSSDCLCRIGMSIHIFLCANSYGCDEKEEREENEDDDGTRKSETADQ